MSITITEYAQLWKIANGGLALLDDPISVRLVTSGYIFSAAHTMWDNGANDATDPSYNEVAAGGGYATGGIVLTGATATNTVITYNDATWPGLTKTFRAGIGVANGTYAGIINPLLFYLLFDSTPADITVAGLDYSILWDDANGLFYKPA
mgnify:CR=1 FL=1